MRRFVLLLLLVAPMVVPGAAPSLVLGGEEGEAEGEVADADFKASFDGESIRHPIWGITMKVPGVSRWEHPMADQPNFVFAAHSEQDDCSLNLSMFAIPIPLGITAAECRIHYPGNPDPLRGDPDVTLHLDEAAPVALTLFDLQLSSEGLTRNTLYGYWSYSSNCFELISPVSGATPFQTWHCRSCGPWKSSTSPM